MKNLQKSLFLFAILFTSQFVVAQDPPPWDVNIINRNIYIQGDHTIAQVNDWQSAGIQSIWLNSVLYSDISRSLLYENMLYFFDENHQYNKAVQLFSDPEITSIPSYRINEKGDRIAVVVKKNREFYVLKLLGKDENGLFIILREIKIDGRFTLSPDISDDGETLLWNETVGSGSNKLVVLKNASDPTSEPVELVHVNNMTTVDISGDGNWAYAFVWDSRNPDDHSSVKSDRITMYSHYENGSWSPIKPLVIDGEIKADWLVGDLNYDSTFLDFGSNVVKRVNDTFSVNYKIPMPRDGMIAPRITDDGQTVIFMAIDDPNYDYHFPDYYQRRSDAMVIAVHENENDEFTTNYIVDEGYSMHFAYSKLTDTILWTAYDEDPTDWTKVQEWQEWQEWQKVK
jgi:hypothetical protein